MSRSVAICKCRLKGASGQTELDSSDCLLTPILDSFRAIQSRAEEVALENQVSTPTRKPYAKGNKPLSHKSCNERWAPVQVALENLDRALDESDIPRSDLHCNICSKPILEGSLRTFHGACYEDRFEASSDMRPLKQEVQKALQPGDPARELALSLPDTVPRVEVYGLAIAYLHLLRP
jgi:hypothetical protein